MSAKEPSAEIELRDLTAPIAILQHRPTEWLCRAKEQIIARLALIRVDLIDGERMPPEQRRLMVRFVDRRNVVEAELDERLVRTITELPVLDRPPLGRDGRP